jgi:hypothetical protein
VFSKVITDYFEDKRTLAIVGVREESGKNDGTGI